MLQPGSFFKVISYINLYVIYSMALLLLYFYYKKNTILANPGKKA